MPFFMYNQRDTWWPLQARCLLDFRVKAFLKVQFLPIIFAAAAVKGVGDPCSLFSALQENVSGVGAGIGPHCVIC